MGKKRRGPSLEELLARPWCYYCERDFDDLKILISHQKAKHFKCDRCQRRLNTAGGLSVHLSQVHKEQLTEVDNALPNRMGLDVEIFGMEGIPDDVLKAHQQRVAMQFQQAEVERQAVTGNPPAGASANGQPAKKPKLEAASDLKKRLAEHRAKRAEALAGGSSGDVTPTSAGQSATPTGFSQHSQAPAAPSPDQHQSFPPTFGSPVAPAFTYPQTHTAQFQPYAANGNQTPDMAGLAQPFVTTGYAQPFAPIPGQPTTYGAPPSFPQQPTPPEHRPSGLPAASNLPQRPSFGAPTVNAHQMQQMHMGHVPHSQATPTHNGDGAFSQSVDDLISGAANAASASKPTEGAEKPAKKDKSKPSGHMIYSHDTISPEERMAELPRYAFVPDNTTETTLGEVPATAVVGAVQTSDTVIDPAH
ncbi:hypothetical protein PENANT_c013G02372 [Penicillium antarcticum]|uniref:C2H2-type domain-containing protein n=1 Tax=Penicillium antarcticum TaxID=416450 RepID=A0A1V6Q528_9EURO|nr:uncharacterized protein N7508_004278 [Penicillium antarcticum]KAJ5308899.1 hypothetical protein N7508_004278 [Penicillium antarcticum]OQD84363.1 hypothetical protein PENANT_c013G02372 [Penicillium antarcticum]